MVFVEGKSDTPPPYWLTHLKLSRRQFLKAAGALAAAELALVGCSHPEPTLRPLEQLRVIPRTVTALDVYPDPASSFNSSPQKRPLDDRKSLELARQVLGNSAQPFAESNITSFEESLYAINAINTSIPNIVINDNSNQQITNIKNLLIWATHGPTTTQTMQTALAEAGYTSSVREIPLQHFANYYTAVDKLGNLGFFACLRAENIIPILKRVREPVVNMGFQMGVSGVKVVRKELQIDKDRAEVVHAELQRAPGSTIYYTLDVDPRIIRGNIKIGPLGNGQYNFTIEDRQNDTTQTLTQEEFVYLLEESDKNIYRPVDLPSPRFSVVEAYRGDVAVPNLQELCLLCNAFRGEKLFNAAGSNFGNSFIHARESLAGIWPEGNLAIATSSTTSSAGADIYIPTTAEGGSSEATARLTAICTQLHYEQAVDIGDLKKTILEELSVPGYVNEYDPLLRVGLPRQIRVLEDIS